MTAPSRYESHAGTAENNPRDRATRPPSPSTGADTTPCENMGAILSEAAGVAWKLRDKAAVLRVEARASVDSMMFVRLVLEELCFRTLSRINFFCVCFKYR